MRTITAAAPLAITQPKIEILKWVALLAMAIDHINKYLLASQQAWMFDIGRIALPLFLYTFALGLSQTNNLTSVIKRIAISAGVSTPVYIGLGEVLLWWPLNVMYLLLVCAGLKWLYQKKPKYTLLISVLFALVLGSLVEWWWFGILLLIAIAINEI